MESVLTVRMDGAIREQGTEVMKRCGLTPSLAVRKLFEYAAQHDSLPFDMQSKPNQEDVQRRIAAFDTCHTLQPIQITDEELKAARIRERYELDA